MRVYLNVKASEVMELLKGTVVTERGRGVALSHSMAHGVYHKGRVTIVYDYESGNFGVLILDR